MMLRELGVNATNSYGQYRQVAAEAISAAAAILEHLPYSAY